MSSQNQMSVNPEILLEESAKDETEHKEEEKSSDEVDSSNEFEKLEDVEKLVVKSREETTEEEKLQAIEKIDEGDDSVKEHGSPKIEDTHELDDSSQKEKAESVLTDEGEINKEEKRREKIKLLLTGYLEFKTRKEIEKALLNEKKIVAQWLYPFRGSYQKEWEMEMKKLKLGFQKALDHKKSYIQAIQEERKLVELNHLWADSAHYRVSEELFDFMHIRCENLKVRYLQELEETKEYYLVKEKEIIEKCTKAEERAKGLAFMRKSVHDKTLQKTKETLHRLKNEGEFLKKKEIEMINEKHLTHIEKIAQDLEKSISPPEHKIEEIREQFTEWKVKYESFLQVNEKNRKKLEAYHKELPQLEAKVADAKKKLDDLTNENKIVKQKAIEELAVLQREAKVQESLDPKLRKMVSDSEDVMVQLRDRKFKLDKIVRLKNSCDRLETETDKMLPKVSLLEPCEMKQLQENDCMPMIKELCGGEIEDCHLLQNMTRKLSRIRLQNHHLQHNIENLKLKNRALKSDMKKFFHLISKGDWQKMPQDLQGLCELSTEIEDSSSSRLIAIQEKESCIIDENLKLLDKKCRSINNQIIKQVERI